MVNVNEVFDVDGLKKATNFLVAKFNLMVKVTREDGEYYVFAFEKDVSHYKGMGYIVARKYRLAEFVSLARSGMIMSKRQVESYAEEFRAKIKFF